MNTIRKKKIETISMLGEWSELEDVMVQLRKLVQYVSITFAKKYERFCWTMGRKLGSWALKLCWKLFWKFSLDPNEIFLGGSEPQMILVEFPLNMSYYAARSNHSLLVHTLITAFIIINIIISDLDVKELSENNLESSNSLSDNSKFSQRIRMKK